MSPSRLTVGGKDQSPNDGIDVLLINPDSLRYVSPSCRKGSVAPNTKRFSIFLEMSQEFGSRKLVVVGSETLRQPVNVSSCQRLQSSRCGKLDQTELQMKRLLYILILLPVLSIIPLAQKSEPALVSMVETERAFARTSEEQGIRPSFMAFIAEDGILFRPRAVKGKQWMTEHPLPASDKRPVLSWQPSFAGISSGGDMGYTSGPWQFKGDVHDAKPGGFGHFITVWKKQADGSWKFAVDLGISHPEPPQPEILWQLPKNYKQPATGSQVNVESETNALRKLEGEFSTDSVKRGAQAALLSRASGEVRVYREGKLPIIGKDATSQSLSPDANSWMWQPEAADVSRSGDVGYSYGTYQLKTAEGKSESGNYLRVWRKEGGVWKVVIDVANPIPEPQKN